MSDTASHRGGDREVNFGEAVKLFLANYARFQGRSSRGAYWWSVLFYWLVLLTAGTLDGTDDGEAGVLSGLVWLGLLLPNISVTVRRLHDTGKSGWWWLLLQVPLIGWIFCLIFLTQPGERRENAYGPDVEAGRDNEREIIV